MLKQSAVGPSHCHWDPGTVSTLNSLLQCRLPAGGLSTDVPAGYNITVGRRGIPPAIISETVSVADLLEEAAVAIRRCTRDRDCNDGRSCTTNSCSFGGDTLGAMDGYTSRFGVCKTTLVPNCTDFALAKADTTPYRYLTLVRSGQQETQAKLVELIMEEGLVLDSISDGGADRTNVPTRAYIIPSGLQFPYFGALATSVVVHPSGIVSLNADPSLMCHFQRSRTAGAGGSHDIVTSGECVTFSSDSNTISVFAHDWDLARGGAASAIYLWFDEIGDTGSHRSPMIHLLFAGLRARTAGVYSSDNTFMLSIAATGNMNMGYFSLDRAVVIAPGRPHPFSLWGSRATGGAPHASVESSHLVRHLLDVPTAVVEEGVTVTHCFVPYAVGCIEDVCVAPIGTGGGSGVLSVRLKPSNAPNTVRGDDPGAEVLSCSDMGVELEFQCLWPGALRTNATVIDLGADDGRRLTCIVPPLDTDVAHNVAVPVSVTVHVETASVVGSPRLISGGSQSIVFASTFVMHPNISEPELIFSPLLVRYFHSLDVDTAACGCNALLSDEFYTNHMLSNSDSSSSSTSAAGFSCDACNTCDKDLGRTDVSVLNISTSSLDCHGSCYGSAFVSGCRGCSGGYTGVVPDNTCDDISLELGVSLRDMQELYIKFTILLLFYFFVGYIFCALRSWIQGRSAQGRRQQQEQRRRRNDNINGAGGDTVEMIATLRGYFANPRTLPFQPLPTSDEADEGESDDDNENGDGLRLQRIPMQTQTPSAAELILARFGVVAPVLVPRRDPAAAREGFRLLIEQANAALERDAERAEANVATRRGRNGLNLFEIDALGTVRYSDGLSTSSGGDGMPASSSVNSDCPICIDEFREGDVCRSLPIPCGHLFHQACIDGWLEEQRTCPLCKRDLFKLLFQDDDDDGDGDVHNPLGSAQRSYTAARRDQDSDYESDSETGFEEDSSSPSESESDL